MPNRAGELPGVAAGERKSERDWLVMRRDHQTAAAVRRAGWASPLAMSILAAFRVGKVGFGVTSLRRPGLTGQVDDSDSLMADSRDGRPGPGATPQIPPVPEPADRGPWRDLSVGPAPPTAEGCGSAPPHR